MAHEMNAESTAEMTERAPAERELIYVADPMCSWCWGFAPVIEGLSGALELPVQVVVGGLRPGLAAGVVDAELAGILAHHWHEVEKASGQPFDHSTLERRGWRYDTLMPAVALVAVRRQAASQGLAFLHRLQRAFYADGVDITSATAYPALLDGVPVDPALVLEALGSEAGRQAAHLDFNASRQLGVRGFPALLLKSGDRLAMATHGWQPLERLQPLVERWFERPP